MSAVKGLVQSSATEAEAVSVATIATIADEGRSGEVAITGCKVTVSRLL